MEMQGNCSLWVSFLVKTNTNFKKWK